MLLSSLSLASLTYLASSVLAYPSNAGNFGKRDYNGSMIYDFQKITPSPDLHWTPCFDQYVCARLVVPLDYANHSIGNTSIAYIKLPAENETASTRSIQINGGGPGVTGFFTMLQAGPRLRNDFGPEYNLVAADPRGLNNSGPSIGCFPGNPEKKLAFEPGFMRVVDDTSEYALRHYYEISNAYGDWCAQVHGDGGPGRGRYANTVAVATDMLNFAEKQNQANGLKPEDAKVWYYGGSYGTALGMTFATLFPERVGRAIIDSVLDADEYFSGSWITTSSDTPKAFAYFCDKCHEAGSAKCPFWEETPQKIQDRAEKVVQSLKQDPIPVSDKSVTSVPQIVTYELWSEFITDALFYEANFTDAAIVLKELENKNGTGLWRRYGEFLADPFAQQMDTVFIACLDAAQRLDMSTAEKWKAYVQESVKVNPINGNAWAGLAGMCSKTRAIVPPKSQLVDRPLGANHTSNPLLFISNDIDPATAIKNAYKMSARFAGSGFLKQRLTGHGYFAETSNCTVSHIRAYLKDSTLPSENTTCQMNDVRNPFEKTW